jgi:hypothetical protein
VGFRRASAGGDVGRGGRWGHGQLSRWQQELASRQDPAPSASGHGNPEPSCAGWDDLDLNLDLPKIGPVQAYTPDALPLTGRRDYTRQERLALVTE